MTSAVLLAVLLSQTAPSDEATKAAEASAKAADAAQKAADAAQKAAEAATTILKAQCPPTTPAAPAAAAPAKPPDMTPWASTIGLGFIWLTGNTNTLTFNGNASADKKWDGWGIGIKAFGVYGQTSLDQGPEQVTALAAGVKVRGARDITPSVPVFLSAGTETNHIKSVESLSGADLGAGIIWAQQKEADFEKLVLRTDLSMHYEYETDFQYYPSTMSLPARQLLGPRVALAFRYAMRKDVIFTEDGEVILNILGATRARVNSTTKLAARLTSALSITFSFQVNYDSAPPPSKLDTDTALMAGVEVAL